MRFKDGTCICGTTKVSSRGQIVIPKKARDFFDFNSDDELVVIADPKVGITIMKADSLSELSQKLELYEKERVFRNE